MRVGWHTEKKVSDEKLGKEDLSLIHDLKFMVLQINAHCSFLCYAVA